MNPLMALAFSDGGAVTQYVDDVFSAYTYAGTGSASTITNGVDLAGQGGMVWFKARTSAFDHRLVDTARGATISLGSNTTAANATEANGLTAFTSTGYSLNSDPDYNKASDTYASWTFRKAPKFFDVVTYTGNGANRTIAHSLGQEIGMMFVKRTDTTSDWQVYHRGLANTEYLVLNSLSAKATDTARWNSTTATSSVFSVGTDTTVNASGGTYVAYVFAHNAATDGNIQCGTFTTDGSGNASVTSIGWEPQFILAKKTGASSGDWIMLDTSRVWDNSSVDTAIFTHAASAESTATDFGEPTATGFNFKGGSASATYIYMAIRRSNKPPTTGTQVFNAISRAGTGAAASVTGVGFSPDFIACQLRNVSSSGTSTGSRLQGTSYSSMSSSAAAVSSPSNSLSGWLTDGISIGGNAVNFNDSSLGSIYINWFLKRAVGVFDVVCDTGTAAAHTIQHGLGAIPELLIRKCLSASAQWEVYCSALNNTEKLVINSTAAKATDSTAWNSTTPTASAFTVGTGANVNTNSAKYATYLFATKSGISKVGSYTGNGSSLNVDCGFAAGARFVMIKRTDSTGDWVVFDSVRGIVAGNDPWIAWNTSAAEVTTDDSIDPYSLGFTVNQVAATNINVNAATYIFLAFA